ncbi:GntR family transcriptional regulator [Oceanobacillus timonensis]|uniref:GntR family transcriptional regulator n=1 Tax=Oceanobacillus timonensis TaxID=1926285 RepID=UPI00117FBB3A|nr:GntR family transcriptional regulator [Oceanobacillus timonensis]
MEHIYRTKKDKVYSHLRENIINGLLTPGERLKISQIARQFEMSEIPVREALQKLSIEEYVTFKPHIGAVVSSMSTENIREIFELRITLEGLATNLSVDHLTNYHLQTLENIIVDSQTFINEKRFEEYAEWNRHFHESIYKHCNNQRLYKLIFDLWSNTRRYPQLFRTRESVEQSIIEHKEILAALKERDKELAEKLTKDHKYKSYKNLLNMIEESEK